MTDSTKTTAEEELLDTAANALLRSLLASDARGSPNNGLNNNGAPRGLLTEQVHDNAAAEQTASDADGFQGGQWYEDPTPPPTAAPTTAPPTRAPTGHPTLAGREFIVRGQAWYDRNANGVRDSNVAVLGMGSDVEFSHVVGGVQVGLVRCDPGTGRAYVPEPGEELDTYASTITPGFNALMKPQIVMGDGEQGKFNIRVKGLEMHYYIEAKAPAGFYFTSGMCDPTQDDVPDSPFKCDYANAVAPAGEERRERSLTAREQLEQRRRRAEEATEAGEEEEGVALGFAEGRSERCVYVDKYGMVEESLSFGLMREGDTQEVDTNVALVLAFDDTGDSAPGRRLARLLRDATLLDKSDDGTTVTARHLLAAEDRQAIGTVTAEILASTLDKRLADEGVQLDSVSPKEVILSTTGRPSSGDAPATAELAVAMEVRGHYSPPPAIDFDYLVQDSINRDTSAIRRGLREYNSNCKAQASKVDQGLSEADFNAVVSMNGAARPGRGGSRPVDFSQMTDVYSTACEADYLVPEYFETSLREIEARTVSEVMAANGLDNVLYVAGGESRGLDAWAVGPVAGIAGLIVLLAGAFVFRRAIGPRRADKNLFLDKTQEAHAEETRRFGEADGDADDASVDSAFYSDDEEADETEKERKMRRRRKEKGEQQKHGSARSMRASRKKKDALAQLVAEEVGKQGASKARSSRKRKDERLEKGLAVSRGSDDTESLEKSSNASSDDAFPENKAKQGSSEKGREKKRASKERSSRSKAGSKRKSERRGRSTRSGGDNAKAAGDASKIV